MFVFLASVQQPVQEDARHAPVPVEPQPVQSDGERRNMTPSSQEFKHKKLQEMGDEASISVSVNLCENNTFRCSQSCFRRATFLQGLKQQGVQDDLQITGRCVGTELTLQKQSLTLLHINIKLFSNGVNCLASQKKYNPGQADSLVFQHLL